MPHQSLEQKGISAAADKKQKAEMMDKKEWVLHRASVVSVGLERQ
jgi:hypothetical protein